MLVNDSRTFTFNDKISGKKLEKNTKNKKFELDQRVKKKIHKVENGRGRKGGRERGRVVL